MSHDESSALVQLYRALGEVVAQAAESRGVAPAGRLLADFGVRHLGADSAAICRYPRRGGPEVVAATDEVAGEVVAIRARYASVPGGAPLREGEVLLVAAATDRHPPAWYPEASRLGLRSILLAGLPPLSSGPATLELYSYEHAAFAETRHEISWLAHLAGSALRFAERRANLEDALQTRDIIGRAQGVLMERYRLTGDQAMSYLRRHSQQSQEPIRQLAARVVGQHEAEARAGRPDIVPD